MTGWSLCNHRWEVDGQAETTRIDAELNAAGDMVISGVDTGAAVERWHGDWDYEYWMTIASADLPAAFAALARHALNGGGQLNWSDLQNLFTEAGVPFSLQSWA